MAKLTTRSLTSTAVSSDNLNKGSALTISEMDSNFLNLNTDKIDINGPQTFNGDLTITSTTSSAVGSLIFKEASDNGSDAITLKAPTSTAAYTITLPATAPVNGYGLTTDGSGNLSWVENAGDITEVIAGAGMTGGADSGIATVNVIGGNGITVNADNVVVDTSVVTTLTDTQTLTNKTLTTPIISSISNSGTITLPTGAETLVGRATTDTLTNKSIDADNNTITNIELDNLKSGVLDTDISAVAGTDTTIASAKAIKTYVDAQIATKDALSELSGDSDDVSEGSTNLYFTNTRADARITNAIKDEDDMASNSATHIPSQQSVKAYVDGQILTKDNTDEITEGSSNLYFTNARADARIAAASINALTDVDTTGVANGKILKYNSTTSKFEIADDTDTDTGFTGASNLVVGAGVYLFTPDSTSGIGFQTSGSTFATGVDYITIGKTEATDTILPNATGVDLGSTANRFDVFAQDIDVSSKLTLNGEITGDDTLTAPDVAHTNDITSEAQNGTMLRVNASDNDTSNTSQAGLYFDQASGRMNFQLIQDLTGAHSKHNSGSGIIHPSLSFQTRDDGSDSTRATMDIMAPYKGETGATLTSSSGATGKICDINTTKRIVYLQDTSGTWAASQTTASGQPVEGTIDAVVSIGTNAVALQYNSSGFTNNETEGDLATLGKVRISTKDVMNGRGIRTTMPTLDIEAGQTNLQNVVVDDAGGVSVKGPDYGDILTTRRNSTNSANYSIEVASDHTSSALAAGGAAGSFGFGAYSSNGSSIGYAYPGFIAGVLGDGGSLASGSTSVSNNAIEIKLYDNGGLHPTDYANNTQAALFETAQTKLMDGHLVFNESSNSITVSTTANGNLVFDPNGTANILVKPTLPTGDYGPGGSYGWAASGAPGGFAQFGPGTGGTTNMTHINGVLSVKAGTDTPDANMLFNEGIQITAISRGDGTTSDLSWPTLAFDASDEHGALTSPNTNRTSGDQAYGNIWFQRRNKSATNTTQAAVESNQILGGFFGGGSTGATTGKATAASMFMRATEDFTTSANGSRLEFSATANGDNSTTACLDINGDSVVINEDSNDVDFRVESNSEANAIKVDAGTDTVSIETIKVVLPNLPTSDPSVVGQLWNDSGTLKVSAG